MEPSKPPNLSVWCRNLLEWLQTHPEAAEIVIGGGVALSHYCPHRPTFDFDAWWKASPSPQTVELAREAMGALAAAQGATFEERQWGDVLSFDVKEPRGQKVFSFQIARRDRYLEAPLPSPWGLILIESFLDNVAAKMVALVDRTAPRDLVDLYEVVTRGLIGLEDCWDLYLRKRPDADLEAAKQQVLERLEQIEARRPLESIANPEGRAYAQAIRTWYHEHFVGPRRLDRGNRL
jgi:hypothetical protein